LRKSELYYKTWFIHSSFTQSFISSQCIQIKRLIKGIGSAQQSWCKKNYVSRCRGQSLIVVVMLVCM